LVEWRSRYSSLWFKITTFR